MQQFINGTEHQFADLFERSKNACIRFSHQQLPPGCAPATSDIAFERAARGQGITLLVKQGVTYSGTNEQCRRWIETGTMVFPSQREFATFCRRGLAEWFGVASADELTHAPAVVETVPAPQSDLGAAQEALSRRRNDRRVIAPEVVGERLVALVHGQPLALRAVAERVAAHANRVAPRRPATLFFVGPTGVGKTRTAEQLPDVLNSLSSAEARWHYLRLDMNEYREAHRISQLIGSPQGYVGYGDGAQLTRQLARHPRTIVLFDEIEKAHPDIFLALMNAMDSGRLSSAAAIDGRNEIDCRQAMFVFTSNLSATAILDDVDELAAAEASQTEPVASICRRHLREQNIPPELIGRISTFAVFRPVGDDARLQIALSGVAAVAGEYGLTVSDVSPEALAELVGGHDARFGARADEYRIDALLGNSFAQAAAARHVTVNILHAPLRAVAEPTAA